MAHASSSYSQRSASGSTMNQSNHISHNSNGGGGFSTSPSVGNYPPSAPTSDTASERVATSSVISHGDSSIMDNDDSSTISTPLAGNNNRQFSVRSEPYVSTRRRSSLLDLDSNRRLFSPDERRAQNMAPPISTSVGASDQRFMRGSYAFPHPNAPNPTPGFPYAFPDPDTMGSPPSAGKTKMHYSNQMFSYQPGQSGESPNYNYQPLRGLGVHNQSGSNLPHSTIPTSIPQDGILANSNVISSLSQYSRTPALRDSHKLAERKRRKEMTTLFESLRQLLPGDTKIKKWEVLTLATEYILELKEEQNALHSEIRNLRESLNKVNVPDPMEM